MSQRRDPESGADLARRIRAEHPDLLKPSWSPAVSKSTASSSSASKFGGRSPFVSAEHPWPECRECGKRSTFLLQLRTRDFPEEFFDGFKSARDHLKKARGLFQLFHCQECDPYENVFHGVR